jgi:hypothetical protein
VPYEYWGAGIADGVNFRINSFDLDDSDLSADGDGTITISANVRIANLSGQQLLIAPADFVYSGCDADARSKTGEQGTFPADHLDGAEGPIAMRIESGDSATFWVSVTIPAKPEIEIGQLTFSAQLDDQSATRFICPIASESNQPGTIASSVGCSVIAGSVEGASGGDG